MDQGRTRSRGGPRQCEDAEAVASERVHCMVLGAVDVIVGGAIDDRVRTLRLDYAGDCIGISDIEHRTAETAHVGARREPPGDRCTELSARTCDQNSHRSKLPRCR